MKPLKTTAILFLTTILLWGCGHTAARYRPIVDGPMEQTYSADLAECQALAEKRSYLNDDVKTSALMGSGIGAVTGALSDGLEGGVVGAAAGVVLGASTRAWETRDERKSIVCKCMELRGHKVVEK
ncbi:MAG: hypothetical protein JEZ12_06185 [Desulfobacterium sp.]|nr:hypothetical protein [Desulfobacterium sp.]